MSRLLILSVVVAVGIGSSRELVTNGDFELPPSVGWEELAWGEFADTGNCRMRYRHDHHPDRDFEVMVHKMLNKGYKLFQKIEIPTLDIRFSVSARLTSKTENRDYYAAAAICLEYLDGRDSVIGETRLYSATTGCPWVSTSMLHLIGAPDSLNWYDYDFSVEDELANLPGVEPDSIHAINVVLLAYVDRNG